jgi:hypothetical protein
MKISSCLGLINSKWARDRNLPLKDKFNSVNSSWYVRIGNPKLQGWPSQESSNASQSLLLWDATLKTTIMLLTVVFHQCQETAEAKAGYLHNEWVMYSYKVQLHVRQEKHMSGLNHQIWFHQMIYLRELQNYR